MGWIDLGDLPSHLLDITTLEVRNFLDGFLQLHRTFQVCNRPLRPLCARIEIHGDGYAIMTLWVASQAAQHARLPGRRRRRNIDPSPCRELRIPRRPVCSGSTLSEPRSRN